ncbi:TetR/AcrR family transcriptional regulator C-terminal domain-containing protein [Amycolatopsis sp. NPDC048633]|uniref:TetR/AcrR family transcriptional regulator C-terminal domain-containing protein n=1 Tax=Amycolatopsis sp. NPDC048633 TaxID=3157095 RepID=UPI0033CF1A25
MTLNQTVVLDAAIELLDETGLDELTTRKLADRLGVRVGALYWHYANKQALLDAIAEHMLAVASRGLSANGTWRERVTAFANAHRETMLSHPDGARVIATMSTPGPHAIEFLVYLLATLASAGMPSPEREACADVVTSYVNGFTVEEQARRTAVPRAQRDAAFTTGLSVVIDGLAVWVSRTEKP